MRFEPFLEVAPFAARQLGRDAKLHSGSARDADCPFRSLLGGEAVHHGLPGDLFRPSYGQGSYLAFLGRPRSQAISVFAPGRLPTEMRRLSWVSENCEALIVFRFSQRLRSEHPQGRARRLGNAVESELKGQKNRTTFILPGSAARNCDKKRYFAAVLPRNIHNPILFGRRPLLMKEA